MSSLAHQPGATSICRTVCGEHPSDHSPVYGTDDAEEIIKAAVTSGCESVTAVHDAIEVLKAALRDVCRSASHARFAAAQARDGSKLQNELTSVARVPEKVTRVYMARLIEEAECLALAPDSE